MGICRRPYGVSLSIAEEPIRFSKDLQPQECVEHETVEFVCEVTKAMPVTWYKDGKPIHDSDQYQLTSTGMVHRLTIADAKIEDEADYSVTAGHLKSTASLLVDGVYPRSSYQVILR